MDLAWGPLAGADGRAPSYDGATRTCDVYCHGGVSTGGSNVRPTWTAVGQGQAACGTCHGLPPPDPAHASHTRALHGIAPPLDCASCHEDVSSPGHVDGRASVTGYRGSDPALRDIMADPGWSPPTQTCATAYCHGATLQGGSVAAPDWTQADGSQIACGTCHGTPPARQPSAAHPRYVFDAPCVGCHPATATVGVAGGNAIVTGGGVHLDGAVQFTFAGHPAGWAGLANSPGGIHRRNTWNGAGSLTMDDYYVQCTPCHGSGGDFTTSGGTSRVSCGACHPAFFAADGSTSCTFCH